MDIEKIISEMTVEEKARIVTGGDFWRTKGLERFGIRAAMLCDGPHGLRKQEGAADHLGLNESVRAVCFPSAVGLGATFDRECLAELGDALGRECLEEDVSMLLGPGMNIKRSPLCGRNFEYFSEDPCLTGELAAAYIRALQAHGVSACPKHFAVNNQETRRMSVSAQVDERALHEVYLAGFERAVKASAPRAIMSAYNRINGTYCSASRELLTETLRENWGFEGLVVTDWGACPERVAGLRAGVDLEMPGEEREDEVRNIKAALEQGELTQEDLDGAVRRVLTFLRDAAEVSRSPVGIDLERDRPVSLRLARESAVLLKNDGDLLPLKGTERVAFIGAFAKAPRYQGSGSSHINCGDVPGALEFAAGRDVVYAQGYSLGTGAPEDALIREAAELAARCDAAVVFAGLPASYESEGFDRKNMDLPEGQNALIAAVAAANPRTAVVLHNGAPVTMPWADRVPAILEMYLGGQSVGQAAAELLYGEANPCGKLAETFPVKLADNPSALSFPGVGNTVEYREGIYVGYRYYDKKEYQVLFPFGHGLSYTTFRYSDLRLDRQELEAGELLTVRLTVKNTGTRPGKEAVQLYVRPLRPRIDRPVRELRDFQKVALAPGEERELVFTLDAGAFAHYETALHDWYAESGNYIIEAAASSRDVRLSAAVTVRNGKRLPVTIDGASTLGDLRAAGLGDILDRAIDLSMFEGNTDESLGEGGDEMSEAMSRDMTLNGAANITGMAPERFAALMIELQAAADRMAEH